MNEGTNAFEIFVMILLCGLVLAGVVTWQRVDNLEGARDNAASRIRQLESRVALPENE